MFPSTRSRARRFRDSGDSSSSGFSLLEGGTHKHNILFEIERAANIRGAGKELTIEERNPHLGKYLNVKTTETQEEERFRWPPVPGEAPIEVNVFSDTPFDLTNEYGETIKYGGVKLYLIRPNLDAYKVKVGQVTKRK